MMSPLKMQIPLFQQPKSIQIPTGIMSGHIMWTNLKIAGENLW